MPALPHARPVHSAALPASSHVTVTHLWLPLLIGLPLFYVLMFAGGDFWLADHLFQWQGGSWALRGSWLTSTLVHKAGKWLSTAAALLALVACALQWRPGGARRLRWTLLYIVAAVALCTGMVSLLKSLLPMECPWDLLRYGGSHTFIGLFEHRPAGLRATACFPAGHASAGYAWMCLYFAALLWRPQWRVAGLWIGLAAGLVFGIGQQLRGAHFLSHDVATALLCWLLSLGLYRVAQRMLGRDAASQARA